MNIQNKIKELILKINTNHVSVFVMKLDNIIYCYGNEDESHDFNVQQYRKGIEIIMCDLFFNDDEIKKHLDYLGFGLVNCFEYTKHLESHLKKYLKRDYYGYDLFTNLDFQRGQFNEYYIYDKEVLDKNAKQFAKEILERENK